MRMIGKFLKAIGATAVVFIIIGAMLYVAYSALKKELTEQPPIELTTEYTLVHGNEVLDRKIVVIDGNPYWADEIQSMYKDGEVVIINGCVYKKTEIKRSITPIEEVVTSIE